MKLLMFTNYFASHRGGLELIGGRLVRELLRLGQDVRWVASRATPAPSDRELGDRAIPAGALNRTERYLGIPCPIPARSAEFTAKWGAATRFYRRRTRSVSKRYSWAACGVRYLDLIQRAASANGSSKTAPAGDNDRRGPRLGIEPT
jgi:hypothetical protein